MQMTQEQIIEGNKLIAEFMGFAGQHEDWCGNNVLETGFSGEPKLFPYEPHKDWNRLMPVVTKIQSLGCFVQIAISVETRCTISATITKIKSWQTSMKDRSAIVVVWLTCIEFIKWYNQNATR